AWLGERHTGPGSDESLARQLLPATGTPSSSTSGPLHSSWKGAGPHELGTHADCSRISPPHSFVSTTWQHPPGKQQTRRGGQGVGVQLIKFPLKTPKVQADAGPNVHRPLVQQAPPLQVPGWHVVPAPRKLAAHSDGNCSSHA